MKNNSIKENFLRSLCTSFDLIEDGDGRYFVDTPLVHDDGDALQIVLRSEDGKWFLSDEGWTFLRLTYDLDLNDLQQGNRKRIIDRILNAHGVQRREADELVLPIDENDFGDVFYDFAQALLQISDIEFLSRDIVKSTFRDDFRSFFERVIPKGKRNFNWYDRDKDKKKHYMVDCRIETEERPIFVFALANDSQTKDATITLHQLTTWGLDFESLILFEDQERINRKALARLSDIGGKQFSSLEGNKDNLEKYLTRYIQ